MPTVNNGGRFVLGWAFGSSPGWPIKPGNDRTVAGLCLFARDDISAGRARTRPPCAWRPAAFRLGIPIRVAWRPPRR